MNVKLYHRTLGFPELVKDQISALGYLNLNYSRHAQRACIDDAYGVIDRPVRGVDVPSSYIAEVEVTGGVISKIVVRLPYDNRRDLCLALMLERDSCPGWAIVKSVWTNLIGDNHATLDSSKYHKP